MQCMGAGFGIHKFFCTAELVSATAACWNVGKTWQFTAVSMQRPISHAFLLFVPSGYV